MQKYIGTYRIRPQLTSDNELTDNKDDVFIRGKNHTQVYRYNDNTLAIYFPHSQFAKKIYNKYKTYMIETFDEEDFTGEIVLYINEEFFHEIAAELNLETNGARISPFSIKNIPREKNTYNAINFELMGQVREMIKNKVGDSGIAGYKHLYKELSTKLNCSLEKESRNEKLKIVEYLDKHLLLDKVYNILK